MKRFTSLLSLTALSLVVVYQDEFPNFGLQFTQQVPYFAFLLSGAVIITCNTITAYYAKNFDHVYTLLYLVSLLGHLGVSLHVQMNS